MPWQGSVQLLGSTSLAVAEPQLQLMVWPQAGSCSCTVVGQVLGFASRVFAAEQWVVWVCPHGNVTVTWTVQGMLAGSLVLNHEVTAVQALNAYVQQAILIRPLSLR